ncbi:RidA family protein [Miniphocaeibacter massiliensis]|uniref:RidA family protein n=1 Tax=Miniphocaeibacter massiliensis TaxID=2041841 RepID=UPI000C1C090E|nr:RidA family protein [Miniphocaeibacter massiliensis]
MSSKKVPNNSSQHITAGPYSPVIEIDSSKLVVISGQTSTQLNGDIKGANVLEQTKLTLENCKKQLETANCSFEDVFKVTAYLDNLEEWDNFNKIYESVMPKPLPVRTVVGCKLLPKILVEIEMWAVKK